MSIKKRKAAVACCIHCRKFLFPGNDVVMLQQEPEGRTIYVPCCSMECAQAHTNDLITGYEQKIQALRKQAKTLKKEKL